MSAYDLNDNQCGPYGDASLEQLAFLVDEAARTACAIEQLSRRVHVTLPDAYEIQRQSIALRVMRGERLTGFKMGFTSKAKMHQMGVDDLIWGRLTDAMGIDDGGDLVLQNYVHPRVEPEICFLMKKPLSGKVTLLEALAAVEAIAPALEIIDSRYEAFRFSLQDVVADNCSSSGFVIGPWSKPDMDVSNLGMVMSVNGRDASLGSSAAILGHPARSLVAAARCLGEAGESLLPGQILLAGAATEAVALQGGQTIRLDVDQLGSTAFTVMAANHDD